MTTTAQPTMSDVPDEVLEELPALLADLFRETWDYKVRVIYLPDLKAPVLAAITILDRQNQRIDSLELAAEDGIIAFKDPFRFSHALTMYMRGVEATR
jgi:hypothetical protein